VTTAASQKTDAKTDERAADAALVSRAQAGDQKAFELLVRSHQQGLYRVVFRYLKNEADALDVTQRALVKAYKSLDKFRGDAAFKTWLYRIGVNLSLNHIRDNKREIASEIRDDAIARRATGPMRIIAGEDNALLRQAIEELPPKQRQVLELRIYDEMSFKEIAEVAECSVNSAKVNFHHAVKKLRAMLSPGEDSQ
jgi:RNA polymerase sigma-70 factor (ECF subfamily)